MRNPPARILLTGAAGFLGSHLLDSLLAAGHDVVGVDNLSMGKLENIATHLNNAAFRFLERDITEPSIFRDLPADFDRVVHMAAFKIPRYGNALRTLRINSRGTENVLEFASQNRSKVVLASTSDVYGRNGKVPFREDDECVIGSSKVARWSYAVSKLFDEHLAFAYQESF